MPSTVGPTALLALTSPSCSVAIVVVEQCSFKWSYGSKWVIIASMPLIALGCTLLVAVLVKVKNKALEAYQSSRGIQLSPPTDVDALYGLLFASFYYLYLQVRAGRERASP